jgi:sporulation protein YlmC with PRC-barrel domain
MDVILFGDLMEVNEVNGRNVITTDAFNVGKVSGAEMDDQWKITHLYVDLTKDATKELGFTKPFLGRIKICLPVNLIQALGDLITLNKTRKELQGIPGCKGS